MEGLLAVQGTLESLLQHHSSKASILQRSAFFIVQLSHPHTALPGAEKLLAAYPGASGLGSAAAAAAAALAISCEELTHWKSL